MHAHIIDLDAAALEQELAALASILADSVALGAAIGFMDPLTQEDATRFWRESVQPEVANGRRVLLAARQDGEILGTVQLIIGMPLNQPHRCEIAKMIVHPRARRLGLGRALMTRAMDRARELGKTLITLDTRTGDAAESLYASVGFKVAGVIPAYAWNPDGKATHATTYMYRQI